MGDELRKLAQQLRERADAYDQRKLIKSAQIIRGSVALSLLRKKLGR
jgi:hypothetical protein